MDAILLFMRFHPSHRWQRSLAAWRCSVGETGATSASAHGNAEWPSQDSSSSEGFFNQVCRELLDKSRWTLIDSYDVEHIGVAQQVKHLGKLPRSRILWVLED